MFTCRKNLELIVRIEYLNRYPEDKVSEGRIHALANESSPRQPHHSGFKAFIHSLEKIGSKFSIITTSTEKYFIARSGRTPYVLHLASSLDVQTFAVECARHFSPSQLEKRVGRQPPQTQKNPPPHSNLLRHLLLSTESTRGTGGRLNIS